MSISLKTLYLNKGDRFKVVQSRLKGTARGLGYLAARDAAKKLGIRLEELVKPNQ